MLVIAGLGNPGTEYQTTRHNFGCRVIDALAKAAELQFNREETYNAEIAELPHSGQSKTKILLVKPLTFMNLSGQCLGPLLRFYKLDPKYLWVIADDLDLPLGKIRVRFGGESGGHNGLKSVSEGIGSTDYWRIRLGVRGDALRAEHIENAIDASEFVLRPFEEREKQFVDKTIAQSVMIIRDAIQGGELRGHTFEIDGFDQSSAMLN